MTNNVVAPVGGVDLEKLTRELNKLDRTREDHVYQLGLKLIPIRQILQQMNGSSGRPGADGLSPRGWTAWHTAVGISSAVAWDAVARAVDPEGHKKRTGTVAQEGKRRPASFIRQLKRAAPDWSHEQRQQFHQAYAAIVQEWNAHV